VGFLAALGVEFQKRGSVVIFFLLWGGGGVNSMCWHISMDIYGCVKCMCLMFVL
jgi:hypothetical protein